jgi:DNA-binding response OmpR family regulator
MPDITGLELAQMIKETSQVPIIFLTAYYSEDEHVIEGYGTGAVDFCRPVSGRMRRLPLRSRSWLCLQRGVSAVCRVAH